MSKLRTELLRLWQQAATSPDEPDNAHLAGWVRILVRDNQAAQRRLKDDFQRMDRLRQEVANAYRLPTPQSLVSEAAIGHLDAALRVLDDEQGPISDAIARIEAARKLILGEPVEPCPGGCGIDLGHPGNPDRQCACPKVVEQTEAERLAAGFVIDIGIDGTPEGEATRQAIIGAWNAGRAVREVRS